MVTSVTSNIYAKANFSSWEETMIQLIKNDPHWLDQINDTDKEKLTEYPPYKTYILSQGSSSYRFVIYYFNKNSLVQESEFSLDPSSRFWRFINGTDTRLINLNDIISYILKPH